MFLGHRELDTPLTFYAQFNDSTNTASNVDAGAPTYVIVEDEEGTVIASGSMTRDAAWPVGLYSERITLDSVGSLPGFEKGKDYCIRITGTIDAVTPGAIHQFTIGIGAVAEEVASIPADTADAVWDEARADHVAAGSFGQGVASVQGNVTGNLGGNVLGNVAGDVQGNVDGNLGGNVLGNVAGRHAAFGAVRALAACIADATGSKFGNLSSGANSAGAHLAGVTPHRGIGGAKRDASGADAGSMLDQSLDTVMLLNIEPDVDLTASDDVVSKLKKQEFVIALTPFSSDSLLEVADLLLPIGTFAETSGTYVNVAGTWQSFSGVANPVGESRPAWKVLRVIGNLVDAPGFDYVTSEDVRDELLVQLGSAEPDNAYKGKAKLAKPNGEDAPAAEIDTPIYSVDGVVRRASALQLTPVALANSSESNS